jgi:hypothetical protein
MLVTVTTDGEEIYNLEIDNQMAIEDLKALLEAEVMLTFFFFFLKKKNSQYLTISFYSLALLPVHSTCFTVVKN